MPGSSPIWLAVTTAAKTLLGSHAASWGFLRKQVKAIRAILSGLRWRGKARAISFLYFSKRFGKVSGFSMAVSIMLLIFGQKKSAHPWAGESVNRLYGFRLFEEFWREVRAHKSKKILIGQLPVDFLAVLGLPPGDLAKLPGKPVVLANDHLEAVLNLIHMRRVFVPPLAHDEQQVDELRGVLIGGDHRSGILWKSLFEVLTPAFRPIHFRWRILNNVPLPPREHLLGDRLLQFPVAFHRVDSEARSPMQHGNVPSFIVEHMHVMGNLQKVVGRHFVGPRIAELVRVCAL